MRVYQPRHWKATFSHYKTFTTRKLIYHGKICLNSFVVNLSWFHPIKTTLVTGVGVNNLQDTNNSKTFLACKSNHTHACNSMTSYIFYLSQFNLLLIFFNKHSDQELFFYNVWLSACTTRTISDIPCQQYCHLFLDCLGQVFVYDSFISWGWFLGLIFPS